jgi:hypothetical protein
MPQTAGPEADIGWPRVTTGAGSPRQLPPRSSVRTIEVHGACEQGAVPSTNASCVETNVTDVAANPLGTGPPAGVGGVLAAAGVAVFPVAGEEADGVVAAVVPVPAAPLECAVPQPASASAVTSAPNRTAVPDVRGRSVVFK